MGCREKTLQSRGNMLHIFDAKQLLLFMQQKV